MKFWKKPELLPHEWLCGAFMVSLWARVIWATGPFSQDALLLLLAIVSNILVLSIGCSHRSQMVWRVRLLFYPIAMNLIYFLLATAVPYVHPASEDSLLQSIDVGLVGTHASLWLEGLINPIATEILSFCYLWYLFYLFSTQIEYLLGDVDVLKRHYTGLFSIYAIGYACYSVVPAVGPYLAMADQFSVPLEGGWFTQTTSQTVLTASNRVDVFPSLHVAVSVYLLMFDRGRKYWRFLLAVLPCAGIVIATVYLRYHYLIDVVFGFGLSFLALWIARHTSMAGKICTQEVESYA